MKVFVITESNGNRFDFGYARLTDLRSMFDGFERYGHVIDQASPKPTQIDLVNQNIGNDATISGGAGCGGRVGYDRGRGVIIRSYRMISLFCNHVQCRSPVRYQMYLRHITP